MKVVERIPNLLTSIRILLGILLAVMTWRSFQQGALPLQKGEIVNITLMTGLIFLSDFCDGRLARKWEVCSKLGERLDVVADLFYMMSQCYILIHNGYMPLFIVACILIEFIVFIVSSLQCQVSQKKTFLFDQIGRLTAAYYYALPILYSWIIYMGNVKEAFIGVNGVCLVLTLMAIWTRASLVLKARATSV